MKPDFKEENNLWNKKIFNVAGLDEAGRGSLAGPVVAAALVIKPQLLLNKNNQKFRVKPEIKNLAVRDSKSLSAKEREILYKLLINNPEIKWSIGIVSEKIIDKINILQATKLAMKKALNNLILKLDEKNKSIGYILIDGNFNINVNIPQKSIINGDQKIFSIAAAGILAKVTRDKIMEKMHKKYPNYEFHLHKGYGTIKHISNLKKFGPAKIHRKTFYPVCKFANLFTD